MLPLDEITFTYARSSGPGGQNVNKVNSKAILRWNVNETRALNEEAKLRFLSLYQSRINDEGELVMASDEYRDQTQNRASCLERLEEMIEIAKVPPKIRKKTKPTKGSKRRNAEAKKRNSEKKQFRRGF